MNIMMNYINIFSTKNTTNLEMLSLKMSQKHLKKKFYINGSNKDVDVANTFLLSSARFIVHQMLIMTTLVKSTCVNL